MDVVGPVAGGRLPVNGIYDRAIRIRTYSIERDIHYSSTATVLDKSELEITRFSEGIYQPVEYELAPPNKHYTGYSVVLNTPVPGEYLISWATSDQCGLLPRSPTGFGVLVAQFELTQSAAAPTQLGTVSVIKSSYFEGEVPAGTGGHCEPVFEHEKRFDLSLHVALNGTVEPWSRNLANALYVDEQLFYGWSKLKPGQMKY
jgi:hypothetical protein